MATGTGAANHGGLRAGPRDRGDGGAGTTSASSSSRLASSRSASRPRDGAEPGGRGGHHHRDERSRGHSWNRNSQRRAKSRRGGPSRTRTIPPRSPQRSDPRGTRAMAPGSREIRRGARARPRQPRNRRAEGDAAGAPRAVPPAGIARLRRERPGAMARERRAHERRARRHRRRRPRVRGEPPPSRVSRPSRRHGSRQHHRPKIWQSGAVGGALRPGDRGRVRGRPSPDELSYLDAADAMIAAHWAGLDDDTAGDDDDTAGDTAGFGTRASTRRSCGLFAPSSPTRIRCSGPRIPRRHSPPDAPSRRGSPPSSSTSTARTSPIASPRRCFVKAPMFGPD